MPNLLPKPPLLDLRTLICAGGDFLPAELVVVHRTARVEGSVTRPELAALQHLIAGLAADNAMAITVAVEDALVDAGLMI